MSDPSKLNDNLFNDCEVVLNEDEIELPAFRKIFTKRFEEDGVEGEKGLYIP